MTNYWIHFILSLLLLFQGVNMAAQIRERPVPIDGRENDAGFPSENPLDSLFTEPVDSTGQIVFQNTDTIDFQSVLTVFGLDLERSQIEFTIDDVHNYFPAVQGDEPVWHLGVNGSPLYGFSYAQDYEEHLPIGINPLTDYGIAEDAVNYYKAERPFTHLFYAAGTGRENRFTIEHTQNWGRGLNVGALYERLVTDGIYANQAVDHSNLAAHMWYKGKKKHFNSMFQYINNKYVVGANGGIVDTSDYFADPDFDRRRAIPVNLISGEMRHKGNNLLWQNSYDIGKNVDVKINDSINDVEIIPRFRLQHRLSYVKDLQRYNSVNEDTLFYQNFFYRADTTSDSLFVKRVSNEFRIKWLGNKADTANQLIRQNFLADAYARYSIYDIDDNNRRTSTVNDLVLGGNFRSNESDTAQLIYQIKGAYHLADYRQGDYHIRGELGYDVKNAFGSLIGFVEWVNQRQPYTSERLLSNHHQFSNDLDKVNARTIGGSYSNELASTDVSARFTNVSNVLYYNDNKEPRVEDDAISYLLLHGRKGFKFGKFRSDLQAWYQTSTDDNALGVIPFYASADLYYKGPLFKNSVYSRIGFQATYHSAFTLDGFDPATGQFFASDVEYENMPNLNFQSSFSLSRARIFLRLDNLTSFLTDDVNFTSYRKPNHDFAFRAGISWVFVN